MRYTKTILCLMFVGFFANAAFDSAALAGPSAHRIKDGPGLFDQMFVEDEKAVVSDTDSGDTNTLLPSASSPLKTTAVYDGVWTDGKGQMLLLKQIHRSLFLSASDDSSAWQAQCIIMPTSARCIGRGLSNTAGEFSYESVVSLSGKLLRLEWTMNYSKGQTTSGRSVYKKR